MAVQLLPFDPNSNIHYLELVRQRELCGWNSTPAQIAKWIEMVKAGDKGLYWLLPVGDMQDLTANGQEELYSLRNGIGPPPPTLSFQPWGHISLDWVDDKKDLSLANRETGCITFSTFFILKSRQGQGIGSQAMDLIEAKAASTPGVVALTLNTLWREEAVKPEFWATFGVTYDPKARINQDWYASRGYTSYAVVPRYEETHPQTGAIAKLTAVLMKKMLHN